MGGRVGNLDTGWRTDANADAVRAFVHVEEVADTMACPVSGGPIRALLPMKGLRPCLPVV